MYVNAGIIMAQIAQFTITSTLNSEAIGKPYILLSNPVTAKNIVASDS